jgi:hypothetical protein
MIGDILLKPEAESRGVPVEQLVKDEIEAKGPTDHRHRSGLWMRRRSRSKQGSRTHPPGPLSHPSC